MVNYTLKNYLQIGYIIIHNSVEIEDFIEQFKLNYYKFKIDLSKMIEMAPFYGIKIVIQNNRINLRIIDNNLFYERRGKCISFYYRNKTRPNNNISLIGTIGELILSSDKTMTIDQICDVIGCSRSGVRNDLKVAREIIESYGIKIKNQPYHGLIVEGDEYRIRLALLCFSGFLEKSVIINSIKVDSFSINQEIQLENFIKKICDDILKRLRISLSIPNIRKISKYILIQRERVFNDKEITHINSRFFSMEELISTPHYQAAEMIYQRVYNDPIFKNNYVMEVISLTILITVFQQLEIDIDHHENCEIVMRTKGLYNNLTNHIKEWNVLIENENDKKYLMNYCLNLCLYDNFGFLSFKGFSSYGRRTVLDLNPIKSCIFENVRINISKYLEVIVRSPFMNELIYFMQDKLFDRSVDYDKIQITIMTTEGKRKSEIFANIIKKHLDLTYVKDVVTEPEMSQPYINRVIAKNEVIITDRSAWQKECIVIEDMDSIFEKKKLIERMFLEAVTIKTDRIKSQRIDFDINNINGLCSLLRKQSNNEANINLYKKTYDDVLVLIDNNDNDIVYIHFGYTGTKMRFDQTPIKFYIHVAINKTSKDIILVSEVIKTIINSKDNLKEFMKTDFHKYVNEKFKYLIR